MGPSRARHVDENAPHLPGANGEKMRPALPIDILQTRQAKDRLAAGADDKPPAGYQQQVDSYFKAIAGKKKP